MYSKKLVKRKKLIKFWLFYGGSSKSTLKYNYSFLNNIYNKGSFIDSKLLILFIKKLIPLFFYTFITSGQFIFIARTSLYIKSVFHKKNCNLGKEVALIRVGLFSNFGVSASRNFINLNFKKSPAIAIFLNVYQNDNCIREAKLRNIPVVGLTTSFDNSKLVDYILPCYSRYFYTIYFFNKLLFKILAKINT